MHSHNNGFKTALLMGSMVGMMLLIGGLLSVSFLLHFHLDYGFVRFGFGRDTYWNSDKLALRSMDGYPVSRKRFRCFTTLWRSPPVRVSPCLPSTWRRL